MNNETGLDPPGIRVRAVPGLVSADYFAPGYFVWAVLIENLAKIGYEGKNLHMAAYDWRLSFQNTEVYARSLCSFIMLFPPYHFTDPKHNFFCLRELTSCCIDDMENKSTSLLNFNLNPCFSTIATLPQH